MTTSSFTSAEGINIRHVNKNSNFRALSSLTVEGENDKPLEPPTIIYHESAHSIVFRDHLRRAHDAIAKQESLNTNSSSYVTAITNNSSNPNSSNNSVASTSSGQKLDNITNEAAKEKDIDDCSSRSSIEGSTPARGRSQERGEQSPAASISSWRKRRKNKNKSRASSCSSNNSRSTTHQTQQQKQYLRPTAVSISSGKNHIASSSVEKTEDAQFDSITTNNNDESSCSSLDDSGHDFFTGGISLSPRRNNNKQSRQEKRKMKKNGSITMPILASTTTNSNSADTKPTIVVANFTPIIDPLPPLDLNSNHEFTDLFHSSPFLWNNSYNEKDNFDGDPKNNNLNNGPEEASHNLEVWNTMTDSEKEVATMIQQQKCVVKTVKTSDWTAFLHKFSVKDDEGHSPQRNEGEDESKDEKLSDTLTKGGGRWKMTSGPKASLSANRKDHIEYHHITDNNEQGASNHQTLPFHSFFSSVSLLPACGVKMRCYGSLKEYGTGVVFALPTAFAKRNGDGDDEDTAAKRSKTWSWPCGYAAKTEFNIDKYGNLLNDRADFLVSLGKLREMNHTYLYEKNYEILGRKVNGELKVLPYNEIYARVGGLGRIVNSQDICTKKMHFDESGTGRTFENGLGLPVALFVRSAKYADLTALLRIRARMGSILGREHIQGIPLLFITPEIGLRVLTEPLQKKLLQVMSNNLNPFQNPALRHKTQMDTVSQEHFEQKLEELLDLDDDNIRDLLTPEECARLAGGFGATDDSVAHLLMDAVVEDVGREDSFSNTTTTENNVCKLSQGKLQDLVNEGLSAAVRSGDYNTSRQLLILYTLVASKGRHDKDGPSLSTEFEKRDSDSRKSSSCNASESSSISVHDVMSNTSISVRENSTLAKQGIPPPPPPPPLDTDRLRSATNSDGLLAVLGAAEVLKSMKDGNAKRRTVEAVKAIEEWICKSENSVAFRLASWRELRAAQGDLKIATENDSNFMAFISNKAITNRKKFAKELKESVSNTSFESVSFLKSLHAMLSTMQHPCLRLELLQFILGLDNRYSVAHVRRSVELAATCLNISATEAMLTHSNEQYLVEGDAHDSPSVGEC